MKKILITLSVFLSVFPCFAQQTIELNNWKFHPGDNLEWTKPGFYDSQWEPIKTGLTWDAQGYAGQASGCYRMKFNLPSAMKQEALSDSIRFFVGAKKFMNEWSKQGPAHHCAIGVGHIADKIQKLGQIIGIEVLKIC